MHFIFCIEILCVNACLFVAAFLEELDGNSVKLSIGENIFFLFAPFLAFLAKLIKLRFEKICRTACNRLFVAYDLFSEFLVYRNGGLAVFALNKILELTVDILVSLAKNYIAYRLSTYYL